MAVLRIKEIMKLLPHRQPFLLLDTVESWNRANGQWRENA